MKSQISNLPPPNGVVPPKAGKSQKGFTLLETLVALAVFSLAILGPLTLASYSLHAASFARNQVIAYYLALEGIEYIRNLRDTNSLSNRDWFWQMSQCENVNCLVDVINNDFQPCGGTGCQLLYDNTSGEYNHDFGSITPFTRVATIVNPYSGRDYEALVRVTISWPERFGTKSIVLEEHLFNWK